MGTEPIWDLSQHFEEIGGGGWIKTIQLKMSPGVCSSRGYNKLTNFLWVFTESPVTQMPTGRLKQSGKPLDRYIGD